MNELSQAVDAYHDLYKILKPEYDLLYHAKFKDGTYEIFIYSHDKLKIHVDEDSQINAYKRATMELIKFHKNNKTQERNKK